MGYDNENSEPLVLDIETMARAGIEALLDKPSAPANYKDPVKIEAVIAEKTAALIDNAALNLYLNQITCIGIWAPSLGFQFVIAKDLIAEKAALAALALVIGNSGHRRRVIGFNSLDFDFPNLIERAVGFHELEFPLYRDDITPKWKHANSDLMEHMTYGGRFAKRSLDFYCAVRGIDSDEPDDIKKLHGSDMPRLAAEGKWDLIAGHCRHDLKRTVKLAIREKLVSHVERIEVAAF